MAGVEIFKMKSPTSVKIDESSFEFIGHIRVRMDDNCDNGWEVLQYILNNGYQYGSTYDFGNTVLTNIFLHQIDPPERVEGSDFLWDVVLHYNRRRQNFNGKGAKNITDIRPSIELGTVSHNEIVSKAFYRGGFNGPGGSKRLKVTEPGVAEIQDGVDDDGSFHPCVDLHIMPNSWGDLSSFAIGNFASKPIQNSAGDPYNPPYQRSVTHGTMTITRNVLSAAVNGRAFPVDWVNSVGCIIFSRTLTIPIFPWSMRLTRWRITEEYDRNADLEYVKIVGEFELKPDTWRLQISDTGKREAYRAARTGLTCDNRQKYKTTTISQSEDAYREPEGKIAFTKETLDNRCVVYEDILNNGSPTTEPVYLNGKGQEQSYTIDGKTIDDQTLNCDNVPTQAPVISYWSVYDEINPLALPFFRGMIKPLNNT